MRNAAFAHNLHKGHRPGHDLGVQRWGHGKANDQVVLFLHVHKSGGSTVNAQLVSVAFRICIFIYKFQPELRTWTESKKHKVLTQCDECFQNSHAMDGYTGWEIIARTGLRSRACVFQRHT